MGEKRRYMRFNVLMDAICRRGGFSKKLKVNNFSKEGVGLLSEESLNAGEDIEIEMMIPGDNMPVLFTGEVAWTVDSKSGDTKHKSGLKFKEIKNSDRSRILGYIYQKWITPAAAEV